MEMLLKRPGKNRFPESIFMIHGSMVSNLEFQLRVGVLGYRYVELSLFKFMSFLL